MTDLPQLAVGDRAPEFALPDLAGELRTLTAARAGQHVVVHFVREFT